MREAVSFSLADSTKRSYSSNMLNWGRFCKLHGFNPCLILGVNYDSQIQCEGRVLLRRVDGEDGKGGHGEQPPVGDQYLALARVLRLLRRRLVPVVIKG